MLGQEALTSRKILGIFIVIAGVVLSQLRKTTTAP